MSQKSRAMTLRTFCESRPSAGGLAEHGGASDAEDDRLGVAEDGGDLVASRALDVHEVRVGVLHQPLELVLPLLLLGARVQKVLRELKHGTTRLKGPRSR